MRKCDAHLLLLTSFYPIAYVFNMVYRSYNVPSIETPYGVYVFSSRLEARWAVYFDNLGVEYDYEPYWFQLPSRNYLPDFWIYDEHSQESFWLEIKPTYPTDSEINLMVELLIATREPGIILYGGIPKPSQHINYSRASGVGIIQFSFDFIEEIGEEVPIWQALDENFLTFDRDFEEVDKALQDATTCYFV